MMQKINNLNRAFNLRNISSHSSCDETVNDIQWYRQYKAIHCKLFVQFVMLNAFDSILFSNRMNSCKLFQNQLTIQTNVCYSHSAKLSDATIQTIPNQLRCEREVIKINTLWILGKVSVDFIRRHSQQWIYCHLIEFKWNSFINVRYLSIRLLMC